MTSVAEHTEADGKVDSHVMYQVKEPRAPSTMPAVAVTNATFTRDAKI
ncbi:hypothetical protein [Streptomyces sp. NPDC001820]